MKAIVYTEYGSPDVLKLQEVAKPSPKENEVLIRVHATGVNAADWHLLRGKPALMRLVFGLFKPKNKILGADVAGKIVATGSSVKNFKVGDEVFGDISGCGFGGFAEYVCARENVLALKPAQLSFVQAAAVSMSAVTALQGLRNKGNIKPGQKVLIVGASGGVGSYAVQLAKYFGAEVTAVCSTANLARARALGADHVIDYSKENFASNGQQYDLIHAVNGNNPITDYERVLSPNGVYVMSGGEVAQMTDVMVKGPWISMRSGKKMLSLLAQPNLADLLFIKELIENGKIKPVIDKKYPLSKTAEAIRYLEAGHAQGKVIISQTGKQV